LPHAKGEGSIAKCAPPRPSHKNMPLAEKIHQYYANHNLISKAALLLRRLQKKMKKKIQQLRMLHY